MSRMIEDGGASVAQKTRTRVIRCPHCSIELNLPDSALGRRLKCPKCEVKFQAPSLESFDVPPASSAASSLFLPVRGGSSGSVELPSYGTGSGSGDVELPTSLAPLRETFELPLLSEDQPRRPAGRTSAPEPQGDVLALFQDEPKSHRKPKGAEARAQARRCTSCSTVVPAGMSLCGRCGLDLDTGLRHAPVDIFEDEMPAVHHAPMPPLGVLMVGGLCALGFALLAIFSLIRWSQGNQLHLGVMLVWLFGLYGGAQLLRRKSIRTLFLGLSLSVVVAAVGLIGFPVYYANAPPAEANDNGNFSAPAETSGNLSIRPLEERIDLNQIYLGVGSLLSYAGLALYLNSPSFRRQFHRR